MARMVIETLSLTAGDIVNVSGIDTLVLQVSAAITGVVIEGSAAGSGSSWGRVRAVSEWSQTQTQGNFAAGEAVRIDCRGLSRLRFTGFDGTLTGTANKVPFESALPLASLLRAGRSDIAMMATENYAFAIAPTITGGTFTTETVAGPGGTTQVRRAVKTGSTGDLALTWDLATAGFPIENFSGLRGMRLYVRVNNDSTGVPNDWATSVRRVRLRVWGETGTVNGLRSDRVELATTGSITVSDAGNGLLPGWQEVTLDPDDFRADGGTFNDDMRVSTMRVTFETVQVGFEADIAFVGPAPVTPGTFDLQFDDCRRSVYHYLPTFEAFGVRPTFGFVSGQFEDPVVTSSLVGEAAKVYMTLDQCRDAFARGAYFVNHSRTHTNYGPATSGDIPTIRADYEACADAIDSYGLNRNNSALNVILPFGGFNIHVYNALAGSSYGFKVAYRVGYQTVINGVVRYLGGTMGSQMRINPDETQVTLAEITAWLDRGLRSGRHITFMGHEIGDYVGSSSITNTRATIRGILEHCRAKGYINLPGPEAVMVSELYTAS